MIEIALHDVADDAIELDEIERAVRLRSRRRHGVVRRVHLFDELGDERLLRREVIREVSRTETELACEIPHADRIDTAFVERLTSMIEDPPSGTDFLRFRTLT